MNLGAFLDTYRNYLMLKIKINICKEWRHFKYLILGDCIIHRKQILKQNMSLIPVTLKILGLCDENSLSRKKKKSGIYQKNTYIVSVNIKKIVFMCSA